MKIFLKIILAIICLVVVGALGFYIYNWQQRAAFLRDQKGEIVFMRRDGPFYKIYMISANGQNEKLVFANDDKTNANSMSPQWADDGSRIRFTAMKDGKWSMFDVNADGGDLRISESENGAASSFLPVPEDMRLDHGSLFVKQNGGETLIYGFNSALYDPVSAPGAQNPSWSPDKQYIVFESGYFGYQTIMIADKDGKNVVSLTDGSYADWK